MSVSRHNLRIADSCFSDRLKDVVAETLLHIVSINRDVGCCVILGLHHHRGQSSRADPVLERVRIQGVVCGSDAERSLCQRLQPAKHSDRGRDDAVSLERCYRSLTHDTIMSIDNKHLEPEPRRLPLDLFRHRGRQVLHLHRSQRNRKQYDIPKDLARNDSFFLFFPNHRGGFTEPVLRGIVLPRR